ncbi:hypothetical protein A7W90_05790 [Clostridium sp. Bc-iso-3]|uniref:DNA-binding protein n=1 Tax=Desulfitobacterium dehalogenans TaxID=36854 RepID=A0A7C7D8Q6_9FIRM|nr:hypothetical protein A7W90_05790 [Clostridium sp. Bc-iso-3]HHY29033.1 hypothetical protein [Desulfitobacterium dehalogenans]
MTNAYSESQSLYIKPEEIRDLMGISRAYSYKIVKQLNDELEAKGFLIIPGRTSRKYFAERMIYRKVC